MDPVYGRTIELSVVIPAYNEEGTIITALKTIKGFLEEKGFRYEVIVVDDGSADKTKDILEEFVPSISPKIKIYHHTSNQGKGASVKKGILESEGEYILFLDADLSTSSTGVENFLPYFREGFDIVIGSRKMPGANILKRQPFYRQFKCFRRAAALNLFAKQQFNDWSFDAEILSLARRYNYRIKELPVCWSDSSASKVVLFRDTLKSLLGLLRLWALA